jgi:hypothetical protein
MMAKTPPPPKSKEPGHAEAPAEATPSDRSKSFMLADLARSRLTDRDIDVEPLPAKGFDAPRYRIAYPGGYYRDRFDRKDDKYIGPKGKTGIWFRSELHQERWRKSKRKLVVEGEKKAAAGVKHLGLDACGIGGCWGFSHHRAPLVDLFDYIAPGDRVDLVLDGDVEDPDKNIGDAARCFVEWCRERGATVRIPRLGHAPDDGRLGLDDWLAPLVDEKLSRAELLARYKALEAIDPAALVHPVIREFNARHAVVFVGGKAAILREERDVTLGRDVIRLLRPQDLELFYANRPRVQVGDKKAVTQVTFWIKHQDRRTYDAVGFWPPNGNAAPERAYNLWRGFAVEPKPGDCSLYLALLRDVICSGNKSYYLWLIAWMAQTVQHPAEKLGTAVVLRGGEGVGKGTAAQGFMQLFGQHSVHVTSSRMVTGTFNAHLKDAIVLFADEAVFAGDPAQQGAIYGLITEKTISIEHKFFDVTQARSYLRVLMASNHDWVVPAGRDARRFFVLDVAETHRKDHAYFAALHRQMENGGDAALLHYLQRYDYSGVNLRETPLTEALFENKLHTLKPTEKFWLDVLVRGTLVSVHTGWAGWVTTKALHYEYVETAQRAGVMRRGTETELGMALHKLVPNLRRSRRIIDKGGRRVDVWEFPPLAACRAAFERLVEQPIAWTPNGEVSHIVGEPNKQTAVGDEQG